MDMRTDVVTLLPEALLFLGGMASLVGGSFTRRSQQWRMRCVAAVATTAALVAAIVAWTGEADTAFSGTFEADTSTSAARVIVSTAILIVLAMAGGDARDHPRESETCSLILFSGAGTLLLAGSTDLALLIVAFLLSSIPLYGLVGIIARPGSAEAALKTYLFGALFGIVLMLGAVLLYAVAGATGYAVVQIQLQDAPQTVVAAGGVMVLAGLLFKAGGVPAHFWVPDATAGASVTAAAFLTTVPKIGAVIAMTRLVSVLPGDTRWASVLGVFAVASMTLGNLAALPQTDVRRLLGWSTVSQVGYLLAAAAVVDQTNLGTPALLFFLAGYALTNLAAFAIVAAEPHRRSLDDWAGAAAARPWLVVALTITLLGLVGTPPTAVFVGKLATLSATWDAGLSWLAVALALNTVASLYYYLRWIRAALTATDSTADTTRGPTWLAYATAASTLVLGLAAGPVLLTLT